MMNRPTGIIVSAAVMSLALAAPAFAHTGVGAHGNGLMAGFLHPLAGLDHMLAMLGVGVWAAQLGQRATWMVAIAFVALMVLGALLPLAGAPLPIVELGIAGSVLVIGALIAFGARMTVGLAMGVVGLFALFHGHAHGTELPGFADPRAYGVGFVAATALLHATGVGVALAVRQHAARLPFRIAGTATALFGGSLLLGALSSS
jgi:urease accessory protein